jgi:hypothetical protein
VAAVAGCGHAIIARAFAAHAFTSPFAKKGEDEDEEFSSSRPASFQIRLKRPRSEPIVANF